ncbi:DUF6371 domain-containing protein [Gracilimonas mengyeensis]|uniref:Toprim-like n=1 Tax=Gracilimonas mengyeensis TaxID=1302730 RepID=A0A521EJT0_9BACT|nr:DUF6371 domain-containing protein [Gracilimonas mengyeensis]SMO84189.1 hypothetical protein SAMN06265219_11291 [Gracilimonas mengyeensis]
MALTEYKYQLDPGSKKFLCPSCERKRFVRYVAQDNGNYLPEDVGRCDREQSCGYHKPPRQADGIELANILYKSSEPRKEPKASTLPKGYLKRSLGNYERNTLITWMATLKGWSWERATETAQLYKVGTSKDGWAIFWQIDQQGKIRSGKMMAYDTDGHRIKEGYSQDWIHSKLQRTGHLEAFELVQCFYGLHIVDDSKPVAIVESEKTALIASQYLKQFHWIASGQLHGINEYKMKPLAGRSITLFPDIGVYDQWKAKAEELKDIAEIKVSTLLEENAPEKHSGFDIADYLINYDLRDFSPHGWNPFTGEIFDERGYPKEWDNINTKQCTT